MSALSTVDILLQSGSDSPDSSQQYSAGGYSEDEFELVDLDQRSKSQEKIPPAITEKTKEERVAELKQGLRDGSITPNQRKNVERLILDLESGIQWYLYQDGRQVTHLSRNFSRVLWKEASPDDICVG
ncbi:hypothetical protein TWF569_008553 [Orbilia oligospora]|uniref:Uncharacterized protein n=1 Tax=Orbilia oligospora TaxID=2813651 RepID=A0A7C8N6S7_ORBOL|nr:hypothetical protein TWF103_001794 [Orbilia oligospora]KAF3086424.1 hypothetical protein TWF102_011028 [Orbilia oligospora]KAF3086653.1 hypothetical protein TWF706_011395 [Orbilia oligospora]KAF3122486.1 hypothetical protein TWF703_001386 [Orbilia oligospora]KAF3139297.1 hypothetical protein TWF569_008553 [Orbilia oligospora]